ncbi:MAG: hypothetical protein EOL90_10140 [Spartobacteria bacterium]|nr:hypothetical protein [Spartobacteria bacterium]
MKSKLAWRIGWGLVFAASAAVAAPPVRIGAPAPAPTLLTSSGDSYKFLAEVYGTDPQYPEARRSAAALLFVDPEAEAGDPAVAAFVEVARKVAARPTLRGQIRFYLVLVCPKNAGFALARFLEQQDRTLPIDVLLDPRRKAAKSFGVDELPRLFAVARDGTLAADVAGLPANYRKQLAKGVVAAIQAGRAAQTSAGPR